MKNRRLKKILINISKSWDYFMDEIVDKLITFIVAVWFCVMLAAGIWLIVNF